MVVFRDAHAGRTSHRGRRSAASGEAKVPSEEINPGYGRKTGFRKVTITLPPGVYRKLVEESARRKVQGEPNSLLSSLMREAVAEYLERVVSPKEGKL